MSKNIVIFSVVVVVVIILAFVSPSANAPILSPNGQGNIAAANHIVTNTNRANPRRGSFQFLAL